MVMVSYEHYGILIFAQGAWKEKDKVSVIKNINQLNIDYLYRASLPNNCDICNQIHDIFAEIKGKNDGIMYVAHAYLETDSIKKLADHVLDNELVKKIYLFQGGPMKHKKGRPVISNRNIREIKVKRRKYQDVILKERLISEKYTKSDFIKLLEQNGFQFDVLYEITRDKYHYK